MHVEMSGDDAEGDDDADIVVSRTHQSVICQLTQRTFEHPVKNPRCSHSYSHDAITQLSRGSTIACPIAGCGQNVVLRSLVPDTEMEQRLESMQNRIFN